MDLHENNDKQLKIKWEAKKDDDSNGGYDYNILHNMLSKVNILKVKKHKEI